MGEFQSLSISTCKYNVANALSLFVECLAENTLGLLSGNIWNLYVWVQSPASETIDSFPSQQEQLVE
jgi:hypothetical protein